MERTMLVVFLVTAAGPGLAAEDNFHENLECTKENTYGYAYLQFFPVDTLVKHETDESKIKLDLYLEFYVKAERNAFVLLTDSDERNVTWGYEIMLGGVSNTVSQIRLIEGKRKSVRSFVQTRNILSHLSYRGFWVKMMTPRLVTVGKIGSNETLLFVRERKPKDIRFLAFSTWSNVHGSWYFNCTKAFDSDAAKDEVNLPAMQRLKKHLLSSYDPFEYPHRDGEPAQTVNVHLDTNYFHLDEKRGELELRGTSHLKWIDWKLQWDPADYDGVDVIYLTPLNVWTPVVHVMNSLSLRKKTLLDGRATVIVGRNGEVSWKTSFHSVTSCALGYRNWPVDDHNCSLVFGFVTEPLDLNITAMIMPDVLEWEIREADEKTPFVSDVLDHTAKIDIRFRRRDFSVEILMFPPFIGAAMLTFVSFWIHPMSPAKLFLNCTSIFILILMGVGTVNLVPKTIPSAPQIVVLYTWSVAVLCVPIFFFIALRYLPLSAAPPPPLRWFMSNCIVESLCYFSAYRETESDTFEERQRQRTTEFDYVRIATLVERFVFLVYFAALVVPFAMCVAKLKQPNS